MYESKSAKTINTPSKVSRNEPFIQPSLKVGKPGDKYEVEADQMADRILEQGSGKQTQENRFFSPTGDVQLKPNGNDSGFFSAPPVFVQQETEEEDAQLKIESDTEVETSVLSESENSENKQSITPNIQASPGEINTEEQLPEVEEEEEAVQTAGFLQKSADQPDEELKEIPPVQTKSDEPGDASAIEPTLNKMSGGGSSLSDSTKAEMESGFGVDFSNVRVHTGSDAIQMNESLNAQAFTHGSNIYFNEGRYNPGTNPGKHLLAHELTHTIQQGASIQPKMIQKEDDNSDAAPTFPDRTAKYDMTTSPPRILIESLPVPPVKYDPERIPGKQLFKANNFNRKNDDDPAQLLKWQQETATENIKTKLQSYGLSGNNSYVIRHKRKADSLRIGNSEILARRLLIPYWNSEGQYEEFDVDHFVELQTAGWPKEQWGNAIPNYWLLDSDSNQSSGRKLDTSIKNTTAEQVKQDTDSKNALKSMEIDVDRLRNNTNIYNALKNRFDLYFGGLNSDNELSTGDSSGWTRTQILNGNHVDTLMEGRANNRAVREAKTIKVYDLNDAEPQASKPFNNHDENVNAETLGSSSRIRIFRDAFGAAPFNLPWEIEENEMSLSGGGSVFVNLSRGIKGIVSPTFISFDRNSQSPEAGHIQVDLKQFGGAVKLQARQGIRWPIHRLPGAQYAGYLELTDLMQGINNAQPNVTVFSPANVEGMSFDEEEGIVGVGEIASNLPLFNRLNLQYEVEDGDFKIYKVFSYNEFNLPSPFEISDISLILSVGTRSGIGIEGRLNFGIQNVGEGYVGAAASTGDGFELEGAFNFDSDLFDPAEINVGYKDNIWTIGGEIGIPEGKVRGIKNATITASYSENNFSASGEAELDIPGIERGNMTVNYGEEGFSITGNFDLSSDIPGIRSGRVEARVARQEGAENYDVMVSGTAQPDIPGIDSTLSVTYENGAITIEGSAAYERGMLSGNVRVGATNRAIGEDGQPSGEPDDTMRVYGGGDLTLQLTPWLEATAGVNFLPNGEIEVTGRIGLPNTVDVFDRREFRRNLFTVPTVEIPIFAIPLGPRSIGLVAQISGGLDFSAGFGPGQLREVYAEVTYNPDHEDETQIHGHGEFVIPADAGLTLRGDLGLGVSVAIASLSGGIELAGTLGLQGEAAASVDLSWSPQTGVTLDAEGRITVNPKFTFDVNAFARASLGIGWFSISETWRYNLVSFSWGPDIQFGIVFPVHYEEGTPFDISFDDIQVIYPDLDVVDMAKNLARDIKDNIFD